MHYLSVGIMSDRVHCNVFNLNKLLRVHIPLMWGYIGYLHTMT